MLEREIDAPYQFTNSKDMETSLRLIHVVHKTFIKLSFNKKTNDQNRLNSA